MPYKKKPVNKALIQSAQELAAMPTEEQVQRDVVKFVHSAYPGVYVDADYSGFFNIQNKIRRARFHSLKTKGVKFPDIKIYEPSPCGKYHGLFIELKKDSVNVLNQDGSFRKDEHLEGQKTTLENLAKKGFYTCFAIGFEAAKKVINMYMQGKL